MSIYVHPSALCETEELGAETHVGAFAHLMAGAKVGASCSIGEHVVIEGEAVVGDRVTIESGVQVWSAVRLADDVFVGPNATFARDARPRNRRGAAPAALTSVGVGASIGANATLYAGVTVGRNSVVEAGAVVTGNVPANAIVEGNPATICGYVDAGGSHSGRSTAFEGEAKELIGGARLIRLTHARDMRGDLVAAQIGASLPFTPKRFFVVYGVPSAEARGEHAHLTCHQLLCCVAGSASVLVDDGFDRAEVVLDDPALALYMPPMLWGTQYAYSPDAVVAVLASEVYDSADYVRDYDEFRRLRGLAAAAAPADEPR